MTTEKPAIPEKVPDFATGYVLPEECDAAVDRMKIAIEEIARLAADGLPNIRERYVEWSEEMQVQGAHPHQQRYLRIEARITANAATTLGIGVKNPGKTVEEIAQARLRAYRALMLNALMETAGEVKLVIDGNVYYLHDAIRIGRACSTPVATRILSRQKAEAHPWP